MSILYAVLCGALQGACEFLPVSSSGHLALLHSLFGDGFKGTEMGFDVLLHLGTLAAVVFAYRRDVSAIVRALFSAVGKAVCGKFRWSGASPDEKTAVLIIVATLPLSAAVFVGDRIGTLSAYPKFVGAMLVLNGLSLILGGLVGSRGKECPSLKVREALGIGVFQLAALLPGISRSGSTITGGRVFGLDRAEAVRFSFLMSIPAIVGANAFSVPDVIKSGVDTGALPCVAGFATAAVVGFLSIRLIKKISMTKNFNIFGIYCIAAGLFTVLR